MEEGRGSIWDWIIREGLRIDFDGVGVRGLLWCDDDWWFDRSLCWDECRDELEEWCERLWWWIWWREREWERLRERERPKQEI